MKKILSTAAFLLSVSLAFPMMGHAVPPNAVAPEIDPAYATGALALLGGAVMMLRERRKRS